jgi:beta-fructofuranosidase
VISYTDFMAQTKRAIADSNAASDPNYPRFHVAPPVGRLNDPNGLIVDNGVYHVFYQFGPFFPTGKLIAWGHATSSDLVNWTQHDPAITPTDWFDRSGVYSGGAIQRGDVTWLHYTGNVKTDEGVREAYQCAVTTRDFKTFEKLAANPLISGPPPGYTAHIRDPFVVPAGDGYVMYLGAQREDLSGAILVYTSDDLENWELSGELEVEGEGYEHFGYMWECPNVLQLADEATGEEFDVLLFSPQGIDAEDHQFRNIFACGYVVGHLEGRHFTPTSDFIELDSGFEFYAPQVFTFGPDEDATTPLLVGWVGNASEDNQPSLRDYGWVHMLTTARDLTLRDGRIYQSPRLERFVEPDTRVQLASGTAVKGEEVDFAELADQRSFVLDLEVAGDDAWHIILGKPDGAHVRIAFADDTMMVDRSSTHYPHGDRREITIPAAGTRKVKVVHDRSVTEIFVGDGHTAFTMRSYLDPDGFRVQIGGKTTLVRAQAAILSM